MEENQEVIQAILAQLDELARQNRRLRLGIAAVVIGLMALLLTGAVAPPPAVIRARSFSLVDDAGHEQASLDFAAGSPRLWLSGGDGMQASLTSGSLLFVSGGSLALMSSGYLQLGNSKMSAKLDAFSTSGAPSLNLSDAAGFSTHIGVADLLTPATGETHKTSAASVVLFNDKNKVIWQVPQ